MLMLANHAPLTLLERQARDRWAPQGRRAAVFILGAPRTGSTVLYQAMVAALGLPYLSNLANELAGAAPVTSVLLGAARPPPTDLVSAYGKSTGSFGVSEGSALMMRWFGGGHPSEVVSAALLEGQADDLVEVATAVDGALGAPLLIKNAWNCFRVAALAQALPASAFIWVRRDLGAAARSDLEARYQTKGDPQAWNSATPSSWPQLRQRPPHEQVVENQLAFAATLARSLRTLPSGRTAVISYEVFCRSPANAISRLVDGIDLLRGREVSTGALPDRLAPKPGRPDALPPEEAAKVEAYAASQRGRWLQTLEQMT